jgi:hypothetical protein
MAICIVWIVALDAIIATKPKVMFASMEPSCAPLRQDRARPSRNGSTAIEARFSALSGVLRNTGKCYLCARNDLWFARTGNVMDLQLTDPLALVSGSTAGIGFALAVTLAREGARVIVNGRKQDAVDGAIASIKASTGRDALDFAGDLSKAEVAEALVKRYPDVAILVNNLGIFEPKPFEEIADVEERSVITFVVQSR